MLERIDVLAEAIRDRPLLPAASADSNAADTDVNSGRRWPLVHCSFKGCSWSKSLRKADRDRLLHHWGMEWCLFRSKIRSKMHEINSDAKLSFPGEPFSAQSAKTISF